MKPILRSLAGILLLAVVLTSCRNNAPKEARYIPKDASAVFVVDLKQMQDKLQKGGISVDSLLARMFRNEPADSKDRAEFNEIRHNAGINWNEKFFVFFKQKTRADKSTSMIFSAIGHLDDAAKLEAYLKKQAHTKDSTIYKEKDYSYQLTGGNSMLAWNDKHIIVTNYTHTPKLSFDTVTMSYDKPADTNQEAELKAQVNLYFTQNESESMADVPVFTGMFKDKADGYMFSSTNSSLAYLSMLPFQIPKVEELIKDNYTTATLNFEDGKIVAKSATFTNPMLSNLLKQYPSPEVKLSMIEKYPSSSINGFMLFSFNPQIVDAILKQLEVEGLVNMALKGSGFTSEDIYKSLKGDISLIVSDLGMRGVEPQVKTDERSMMKKRTWGKMIFHAPVGDKISFSKIMDKGVEMGALVKTPTGYKGSGMASAVGLYIAADNNNFIIASDSLTYEQYIAGTGKSVVNKDILDRFKGKTGAFYWDIATTLAGFSNDSVAGYNQSMITARETFKDIIGSSEQFDGKSVKGNFEVRMQDEKQNSLVTLTRLFTDIAVDMRVQAKRDGDLQDSKLFPGGVPAIIRTN
jgi:hypothetical protein